MSLQDRNERLLQLRRVVLAAPESRFDMNHFRCGTAMCAAGWAASDPWFTERGLHLAGEGDAAEVRFGENTFDPFSALEAFFLLSTQDTERLFAGDALNGTGPITKEEVIENIDLILAGEPARVYRAIEEE